MRCKCTKGDWDGHVGSELEELHAVSVTRISRSESVEMIGIDGLVAVLSYTSDEGLKSVPLSRCAVG